MEALSETRDEWLRRLETSEARFRSLVEATSQLTWTNSPEGEMRGEQLGWGTFTGQTFDEYQGYGWSAAIHPDDRAHTIERWQHAVATRGNFETEHRVRRGDGVYRWFSVRAVPILEDDGAIREWVGVHTDITEQRADRERLRESEERYRVVAETASDAIITIDEASTMLFVNPATERMFGCTSAELVSENLTMLMPEEYRAQHRAGIKRYIATGQRGIPWEAVPAMGKHKDGHEFPLEISFGEFVKDGHHFFSAIVRDITERKRTEAALREREAQFSTLADSIPQLAWMADADGSIFWYNRRWYDYTGTTFDEMQGWGWEKVHDPNELERVVNRFRHALTTGEAWEDTFPLRSREGEFRWFLSRALPIRDAEGCIVRWFGTNTDIHDQKQMEKELARLNAERERMLEEVSTPVVPVYDGILALPLVGSLDTERMRRATDSALSEVARTGAHALIIDITGARIIDSYAVANLGNLVTALKLIGAEAVVTGVTAQAAQSLVGLGLDLTQMRTMRTLAQALATFIKQPHTNGQGASFTSNATTINSR